MDINLFRKSLASKQKILTEDARGPLEGAKAAAEFLLQVLKIIKSTNRPLLVTPERYSELVTDFTHLGAVIERIRPTTPETVAAKENAKKANVELLSILLKKPVSKEDIVKMVTLCARTKSELSKIKVA